VPLVSDFVDVLQEFANDDLLPITYSRATAPSYYGGLPVAGTGGYVDQGALPAGETVVVPAEDISTGERDEARPDGDRARARIIIYTSVQLRAGRNPGLKPDVVTTADARTWQVAKAEDWSASGNFWCVECEQIDA